ncbi:spindle and kinetochore-associated protein 1-like [Ruditapes philippinarum]|uniref:spindle and kinetochore-associated protein 1-like n=1 Tax=Ruditapes philippinarum TaxID=129788 RepID=UPI00295C17E6|nr:spindle and kinetochore-associated protein 1-like [Ruditapes philippinarum]
MDSKNLQELSEHFTTKLDRIGTLLNLRDACQDHTCIEQLQALQTELRTQENNLSLLRNQFAANQESFKRIKCLNNIMIEWKKKLEYMVENIPERLPTRKKNIPCDEPATTVKVPVMVVKALTHGDAATKTKCKQQGATQHQEANQQTGRLENTYFPEIEFLTTEEFEQVPKYIKGRITYDSVNKFIEGMNKSYRAKYKLLKQKKATLNDANRKRCEAYKAQETKETKGCYFIVDEDLKDTGGLKIDNVARSTLTIIRHCGRCREVRGGRITRYVYVDNY